MQWLHFLDYVVFLTIAGATRRIPDNIMIGTAVSSYQVEGAWNVADKGVSYWDEFLHTHKRYTIDGSNGDVACDFYHRYKEDIKYISDIGFDHFRFSLSWPRLLPRGTPDYVSQDGLRFYHSLLDELEARNITPVVTLYHWDHPQVLETEGGWLEEKMVDRFGEYARFVFKEFGPRVKIIATLNEPSIFCAIIFKEDHKMQTYNKMKSKEEYVCMHNILKAHARAYHIYDKEFRAQQKGIIGMVTMCNYFYGKLGADPETEDVAFQFDCGWMNHPIFSAQGDYSEVIKKRVAKMSKFQGLKESKLPVFSKDWVEYIRLGIVTFRGTADYYGVNHYTSEYVTQQLESNRSEWMNEQGLLYEDYYSNENKTKVVEKINSIMNVPKGIIDVLRKMYQEYGSRPVYIMENGIQDNNGTEDNVRIDYLYGYMEAILDAVEMYGIDLRGYTIWSLMDNFEWFDGYIKRFGLIWVDLDDDLKRTPKKSANWMKSVLKNRELQHNPNEGLERGRAHNLFSTRKFWSTSLIFVIFGILYAMID